MERLENTYKLCIEKFKIHQKHYFENEVYEVDACLDGNYYLHEKGENLLARYNWMTSFVIGMAPLFFRTEKNCEYLKWANRFKKIYHEKVFDNSLDTMHDIGFLYSPYSVAMYQLTGDEEHKITAIKAADELLKRFEIKGGYIDAWGRMDDDEREGRAIVDSMINIHLLFWAWKETGYTIYRDVAKTHADTVYKHFVREDGSVCHSFLFDRKTGQVIEESNTCGYSNGSYWARGAAWATYGFAMTARYLNDKKYYEIALKLAEKYISEFSEGEFVPVWDFRLPEDKPAAICGNVFKANWDESKKENCKYNVDSSACAIMACAFMEINDIQKNAKLMDFVEGSLNMLCSDKYLNSDIDVPGIISHQNGRMSYTTYGDFFFVQALQKYLYDETVCW